MMQVLPQTITSKAFQCDNGELAWRRADVGPALEAIAHAGMACLGGELWIVNHGTIAPWYRTDKAGLATFYHWETQSKHSGESWPSYVSRCQNESLDAIKAFRDSDVVVPVGEIYFNLSFVTETELRDLWNVSKKALG